MRVNVSVDGLAHLIDTTDPDILGRWVVEIFGRIREVTPATLIEFQVWPSYVPGVNGEPTPDWLTDSTLNGRMVRISSPRELVERLSKAIDESEAASADR